MPELGRIFEKVLKRQKSTFKKEKLKDEPFEVARTRNCAECGSDEEMRWLALHPSCKTLNKCSDLSGSLKSFSRFDLSSSPLSVPPERLFLKTEKIFINTNLFWLILRAKYPISI